MESIDEETEQWERLMDVLGLRVRNIDDPDEKVRLLKKKAMTASHRLDDIKASVRAWNEVLEVLPGDIETLDALASSSR